MLLIDNLPFSAAIFFSHVISTDLILTAKQLGLSKNRQSVPLKIPKKKISFFSVFVSQRQESEFENDEETLDFCWLGQVHTLYFTDPPFQLP